MLPSFKKAEGEAPRAFIPSAPQPATPALGTRPSPASLRTSSQSQPSIIGPDLLITGNLISNGQIQVEGEVQGDIHSTHVIVGEQARITGGVIADEVIVRGHVLGSVRGKRVLLQTSSHVEGDVYHNTLAIEQGAFFEGKSRRTSDPTAGILRTAPRDDGPADTQLASPIDALASGSATSTFGRAPDETSE
jgi:cytoskeletal protein CcmA (bactofilin family)